jgi:pimeloyl-ACP methyl ester carboxylesterase
MERLSVAERDDFVRIRPMADDGDAEACRRLAELLWKTDFSDVSKAPDFTRAPLFAYPCNVVAAGSLRRSAEERIAAGLAEAVGELRVPVLIVHGADDPMPVECAEDLASRLPCAELVVVDAVGHNPWMEDAASVRRAIRRFLAAPPD